MIFFYIDCFALIVDVTDSGELLQHEEEVSIPVNNGKALYII